MKRNRNRGGLHRFALCMLAALTVSAAALTGVWGSTGVFGSQPKTWNEIRASEWMKYVEGTQYITTVNLPGTHDSATATMPFYSAPIGKCQDRYISGQLDDGVRYFDLRINSNRMEEALKNYPNVEWGKEEFPHDPFKLCHGDMADALVDCEVPGNSSEKMRLGDHVLNLMLNFLEAHPSEFIMVRISEEKGVISGQDSSTGNYVFEDILFKRYIEGREDKWYLSKTLPTVDQARGKIVLLADYPSNPKRQGGIQFHKLNWEGSSTINAFNGGPHYTLWAENQWEPADVEDKWTRIENNLNVATDKAANDFVLTNTNAAFKGTRTPKWWATQLNKNLMSYPLESGRRYGWFCMDYVNEALARKIFSTNLIFHLNGSGTQEDPYLISTEEDFQMLYRQVSAGSSFAGCYFKQTADITMSPISAGVFSGN